LSAPTPDLEQAVRSKFAVRQFFALPEGEVEFQVAYDGKTKEKFALLEADLASQGYRPELTGTKDDCVLTLRKADPSRPKGSRVPVLLALFTMVSLVVFAIFQRIGYEQEAPSLPGYFVFFTFIAAIAGLIGVHELAQRLVARRRRAGQAGSYVVPGVPILPPFLPALGLVSAQRRPALNRDGLFDTVVVGPLAMLALAVVMSALGDLTSVQSPVLYQQLHSSNSSYFFYNSNVIEATLNSILSPWVPSMPAGALPASPIANAASVGFILVFIGLLPMAIFDGGFMVAAAWGERAARVATYLSVLLLLLLDIRTATYWAVAIVGILLAGRPSKLKLLDEVSPLSPARQWAFVGTLVLAFLCLPVPHSIATFGLS
jgi:hypothetical protein